MSQKLNMYEFKIHTERLIELGFHPDVAKEAVYRIMMNIPPDEETDMPNEFRDEQEAMYNFVKNVSTTQFASTTQFVSTTPIIEEEQNNISPTTN